MIDFPNGSLVTPEGVVILGLFRVGVMDSREDLVPQSSIAVRVRRAVRGLDGDREDTWGGREGHAGCEYHLLTMAMKSTVV
jgi:hypothetical protein